MAHTRTWLYLLIPTLGGLGAGLLVFLLAPEAEGHGTDAMIEAFHHAGGFIRKRVVPIKVLASALTIGSGGSAGKEGPIAQIGAGLGSILACLMRLPARDRRILVLAGAAGGIGAIFHAPLGAALFAPEVLYRETEFEFEAIMPCIVASIVASSVFDQYSGRATLFFPGPVNFEPKELLAYVLFGGVCALIGYIYIKVFYGARDWFFHPLKIPRIFKPALGGLMLGAIALLGPSVLDGGYGWIQVAMEGKIIWSTMLPLVFLKIARHHLHHQLGRQRRRVRALGIHRRHARRGLRLSGAQPGSRLGDQSQLLCAGGHRRLFRRGCQGPGSLHHHGL